jgi:hypothetical protein
VVESDFEQRECQKRLMEIAKQIYSRYKALRNAGIFDQTDCPAVSISREGGGAGLAAAGLSTERIAHLGTEETAALRDFDPAYDRSGSLATSQRAARDLAMSASRRKRTSFGFTPGASS